MGNIIFVLRGYNLVIDTQIYDKMRVAQVNTSLQDFRARKEFLGYSKVKLVKEDFSKGLTQKKCRI